MNARITTTKGDTHMEQFARSATVRHAAVVPVTVIPANYRHRLPRKAALCTVQEPERDESGAWITRVGNSRERAAASRPLRLTDEEAETLRLAIQTQDEAEATCRTAADSAPETIYAIPSYLLPDTLRLLDTSRSHDLCGDLAPAIAVAQAEKAQAEQAKRLGVGGTLDSDLVQAMAERPVVMLDGGCGADEAHPRLHEVWAIALLPVLNDRGQRLISATLIPERLEGRATGRVYAAWMEPEAVDSLLRLAMVYTRALRQCESHVRRVAVAAHAQAGGAEPPVEQPEPPRERAIAAATLADDYQLVATKDPIYLRKEDVLASDVPEVMLTEINPEPQAMLNPPEIILEKAMAALEHEQAYLRDVMRRRIDEFQSAGSKRRTALLAQQRADADQRERLAIVRESLRATLRWYGSLPRSQRSERIVSLSALDAGEAPVWRSQPDAAYLLVVGFPTTLPSVRWKHIARVLRWPGTCQPGQRGSPPVPVGPAARIVA